MSVHESYAGLARLLEYPEAKETLARGHAAVATFLETSGVPCSAGNFAAFVAGSTLAEIQEDYVATFDFSPILAPYLGHHLYGDNQKKATYMIEIKQDFSRHGFSHEGGELPDHLGVLLSFLAHLAGRGEDDARRQFLAEKVLPGLKKLETSFGQRGESPWKSVVDTAVSLCTLDSAALHKEAPSC